MNLLVSVGNTLSEYTRDGAFVQSFPIPHPDTDRYDGSDAVVAMDGSVYVRNSAPFSNSYFSRLEPASGLWTHVPATGIGFGNVSDADLSARGRVAVTNGRRLDLVTEQVDPFSVAGGGVGEVSWGLDGLLYALDSGSPRPGIRVLDPSDFGIIRSFSVDFIRDLRGIAVSEDGQIYAAEWDGMVYEYTAVGDFVKSTPTGLNNLLDIDLHPDGTLIVGSRFGEFGISDTALESFTTFEVGDDLTYVAFAVNIPEPAGIEIACAAFAVMFSWVLLSRRVAWRPRWRV